MKTVLFSTLLCAAVLGLTSTSLSAASAEKPKAFSHSVGSVTPKNGSLVTRGQTPEQVIQAIGNPARKLSPDVWVFPGFDAGTEQSRTDDCGILVVSFVEERVADLSLINPAAETVLAARFQEQAKKNVYWAGRGK